MSSDIVNLYISEVIISIKNKLLFNISNIDNFAFILFGKYLNLVCNLEKTSFFLFRFNSKIILLSIWVTKSILSLTESYKLTLLNLILISNKF